MKIGVIGTGMVGQALAGKLAEAGHEVVIGTRSVADTMARTKPDVFGNPPFKAWIQMHPAIKAGTFAQAAAHGELNINATNGAGALDALRLAGESNLHGKVLMDVSNPLDFSKGMPPSLFICNTDSLGEQIQATYPKAKVVKTLNTVNAQVMVNPQLVAGGDHHIYVSGNDARAKGQVTELLTNAFGWKHVIDLGGIATARGVEMVLPLWIGLMGALKTPMFNFKVVQ